MAIKDLLDNGDVIALGLVALVAGLGVAAEKGLLPGGSRDTDYDDDDDYDYDED